MEELKITITGTLNETKSVSEINKVIKNIEKQISKIDLGIDKETLQAIKDFSKYSKLQEDSYKNINKLRREETQIIKNLDGTQDKITRKIYENGEIIQSQTKELQKQIQLNKELIDLYQQQSNLQKSTVNIDEKGEFAGQVDVYKNSDQAVTITKKVTEDGRQLVTVTKNIAQAQKNAQKQLIVTTEKLKDLSTVSEKAVIDLLKFNNVIGNQEVLGVELDRVSGNWSATIKENSKQVRMLKGTIDQANGSLYKHKEVIKQAHSANLGFSEQLKIAFQRVPIWMTAMTAFYGSLRTLQNMTQVIVEVDTAITNLKKVMDTDNPKVFVDMLDSAIKKAKDLGQTVTSVLDSFALAAKAGLSAENIEYLSEASLIAANVGEIEAAESAEYLISAIEQMQMAYSDSMKVIDAWNNLSNKNATTVKDLAEGWARSASTVRNFGGDMHELNAAIGSLNQRLRQSGNEIGNFLKSAFPRLLSSDVQGTLEEIGISVRKSNGEMKDAFDIYREVAKALDEGRINAEQFNQAALALGGRYHVTRVIALIEAMRELNGEQSLFDKMVNESINSVGSASQENLTYLNSIEAQQRKLVATFQEFAIVAGDASLTESYRSLLDVMTELLTLAKNVVEQFGFIFPIMTTLSGIVILFSKRLQDSISKSKLFTTVWDSFNKSLKILNSGFSKLGITIDATSKKAKILQNLSKGLVFTGFSAGISLVIGYLGSLIEKFIQARAEQRELERQTQELVNSYSSNREEIERLVERYKELDGISQRTIEQEQEYVEIANRLTEIAPSLVAYKDEEGNARLRNVEAIDKEIASLRELSTVEALSFIQNFDEETKKVEKNIDKLERKIEKLYKKQAHRDNVHIDSVQLTDPDLVKQELLYTRQLESGTSQLKDLYVDLAEAILVREGATHKLTEAQQQYISKIIDELGFTEQAQQAIELYAGDIAELANKYEELSYIDAGWIAQQINDAFGETKVAREDVEKLIERVLLLKQILGDSFNIGSIDFSQFEVIEDVVNNVNNGSDAWEKFRDVLRNAGLETNQISTILGKLRNDEQAVAEAAQKLGFSGQNLIPVYDELGKILTFTTQYFEEETDAINENSNAKSENASLTEILYGVTADQVKQMKEAIKIVSILTGMENLDENQKRLLADATAYLAQMYPHLAGNIKDSINWLYNEINMLDQLNSASGENAYVMMTNQDKLTKSTVGAVNQRILALNKEYEALKKIIHANLEYNDFAIDPLTRQLMLRLQNVQLELAKAYDTRQSVLYGKGIVKYPDEKPSNKSKSSSVNEREIEKYLTDQYALAVEQLNYQLAQSNSRLEKLSETSSAYRKELEAQKKLYQQQITLADNERKRLESRNQALQAQLNAMGDFNKLSNENKEKYNQIAQEIDKNKSAIIDLQKTALDAADKIYSANEKIRKSYETIADTYISLYKELIQTQRDESIKAIEKELEAFEKAYRRKMDMLDKELELYEEIIKERLRLLEDQKDEEDFNKKLAEKEKERQKLLSQLNEMRLDDSREGRKRVTELEEELAKVELEIQELMRDRERELVKQALEDQLEEKRKQIENQQELEEENYNKQKERLEQQREDLERHYENLLNDERAFAQMREQILAGNIKNLSSKLNEFASFVKNNMKSIGESISQNFLDKIKEAQSLLNGITGKAPSQTSNNNSTTTNNKSNSTSTSNNSSSNLTTTNNKSSTPNASGLPLRKRSGGFATPKGGWDPNSVVDTLKKHGYYAEFSDLKNIFYALGGTGTYKGSASQNSWMLSQLKKRGFNKGGYIPHDGIAWVDSGERVLTKHQTKAFDKLVNWLDKTKFNLINPIKTPSIPVPNEPIQNKNTNFYLTFNIDNLNGTKEDANEFVNIVEKKLRLAVTRVQ